MIVLFIWSLGFGLFNMVTRIRSFGLELFYWIYGLVLFNFNLGLGILDMVTWT